MARVKKLNRIEYRKVITSLVDLGFSVPAICYMVGKTEPATYTLLKRVGRWKNGVPVRFAPPVNIDPVTLSYVKRVFTDADTVVHHLMAVGRLTARATRR